MNRTVGRSIEVIRPIPESKAYLPEDHTYIKITEPSVMDDLRTACFPERSDTV